MIQRFTILLAFMLISDSDKLYASCPLNDLDQQTTEKIYASLYSSEKVTIVKVKRTPVKHSSDCLELETFTSSMRDLVAEACDFSYGRKKIPGGYSPNHKVLPIHLFGSTTLDFYSRGFDTLRNIGPRIILVAQPVDNFIGLITSRDMLKAVEHVHFIIDDKGDLIKAFPFQQSQVETGSHQIIYVTNAHAVLASYPTYPTIDRLRDIETYRLRRIAETAKTSNGNN
jgi:hypothetical protein